jgi:hypothetical protein
MLGRAQRDCFRNVAEGTYGSFDTPAGRVDFLMTQGRLGVNSADNEWQLTKALAPVREVLPIASMDFNQLLQRDLDDHRIAQNLIPYLMTRVRTGPAFFPPLIAVLLPFNGNNPDDSFPNPGEPISTENYGSTFSGTNWGDVFRFEQLIDPGTNEPHISRFGRLMWNSERAKLVVMDGQHRAMALLAINRTANDLWRTSPGKSYEMFYADAIHDLMGSRGITAESLATLHFPVTLCWFPTDPLGQRNPHVAARKLFVDINQNAKPPSQSRLILLSDTELDNVMTRELLNCLRASAADLPLYCVEYDSPDANVARPARWSVLTNLAMLRFAVAKLVFGPEDIFLNVDSGLGGPVSKVQRAKMDEYMRRRLAVDSLFDQTIVDGPDRIDRDHLANSRFPTHSNTDRQKLLDRFIEEVGQGMIRLLSDVFPYRCHIAAIRELRDGWITTGTTTGELAKDALFDGMGVYWTLRDGHRHYVAQCADRMGGPMPPKPELCDAWEAIQEREPAFRKKRAAKLLEKNENAVSDADVENCTELFDSTNTQACQVGLFLTWGTFHHIVKPLMDLTSAEIADLLSTALNASLEGGPEKRTRFVFTRKQLNGTTARALNRIGKLDTPLAKEYRYFWLELLCMKDAVDTLQGQGVSDDAVMEIRRMRDVARRVYRSYVEKEIERGLRSTRPELTQAERRTEAFAQANAQLRESLKYWCGVPVSEYDEWKERMPIPGQSAATRSPADTESDGPSTPPSEDSDMVE